MALGLNVDEPETTCEDPNCPFHGALSVRGGTVDGMVASTDMDRTVVVEREYDVNVPKYDRKMKRRSRMSAHAPDCLDLEVGEAVRLAETRPLSKTKSHVVVGTIETDRDLGATSLSGPSDAESEVALSDIEESVSGVDDADDGGAA